MQWFVVFMFVLLFYFYLFFLFFFTFFLLLLVFLSCHNLFFLFSICRHALLSLLLVHCTTCQIHLSFLSYHSLIFSPYSFFILHMFTFPFAHLLIGIFCSCICYPVEFDAPLFLSSQLLIYVHFVLHHWAWLFFIICHRFPRLCFHCFTCCSWGTILLFICQTLGLWSTLSWISLKPAMFQRHFKRSRSNCHAPDLWMLRLMFDWTSA